jgi:hypothetical protein
MNTSVDSLLRFIVLLGTVTVGCAPAPLDLPRTGSAVSKTSSKTGIVTVTQMPRTFGKDSAPFYYAGASFIDTTPTAKKVATKDTVPSCTVSRVGACDLTACPAISAASAAARSAPSAKLPSAGLITITSEKQKLLLGPGASGVYTPSTGVADAFTTGNKLTIRAAGADVAPFTKTLPVPPRVVLTAPAWPATGSTVSVPRTEDLVLAWNGSSEGSVVATLSTASSFQSVDLVCRFDASLEGASIPAAALAKLEPTTKGRIAVDTRTFGQVDAGGWTVTTIANIPALLADGIAVGVAAVD